MNTGYLDEAVPVVQPWVDYSRTDRGREFVALLPPLDAGAMWSSNSAH